MSLIMFTKQQLCTVKIIALTISVKEAKIYFVTIPYNIWRPIIFIILIKYLSIEHAK